MKRLEIEQLLNEQRRYYRSGETIPVSFREDKLKKLYNCIKEMETEISNALKADLGKSAYESFMCEIGLVLSEITYMRKHLKAFTKKQRVRTPLAQFHSASYKIAVPYGKITKHIAPTPNRNNIKSGDSIKTKIQQQ